MTSILKWLRLLSDPYRVRIVLVLEREELSVAELQEILGIGQSTLSTHLARLKSAGVLQDRRVGKSILYRLIIDAGQESQPFRNLLDVLRQAAREVPQTESDTEALQLVMAKRRDAMRAYFDDLAGKFGRQYAPGRSWRGLAEMLSLLLPPLVVADLGAGEGILAQLLARRAEHVIAVDNADNMVGFGAETARRQGLLNLEYRKGELESLPIGDNSVDVAVFSQSLHHAHRPQGAIAEAFRILNPGGTVAVLDLLKHNFEKARELYADLWLGFTEVEVRRFLLKAGFSDVTAHVVHREKKAPYFETLLVTGRKLLSE
jgi:ArsR family transcriptional regulator